MTVHVVKNSSFGIKYFKAEYLDDWSHLVNDLLNCKWIDQDETLQISNFVFHEHGDISRLTRCSIVFSDHAPGGVKARASDSL